MFGGKNWLVILLTRNSLQIFSEGESAVQTLPLPSTIINNLEVLNKDTLYMLITDWTKQKAYQDTEITWILSPELCFTHAISSTDQDKVDSEILQFLDTVPFEEVVNRTYNSSSGRVLIATNQALINAFIHGFSLHGYTTQSVIPAQVLGMDSVLTPELARNTHKHAAELKRESLITPVILSDNQSKPQLKADSAPAKKSSLPLLLTIFTILLAILGFVLYLNQ